MAETKCCVVVCEGPDDLLVLRAMLQALGALSERGPAGTSSKSDRNLFFGFEQQRVRVHVAVASGAKSGLAKRALELVEGTATFRPTQVALCFDPDLDDDTTELDFFRRDFERVRHDAAAPFLDASELVDEGASLSFTFAGRKVQMLPAPWRASAPASFAALPDEHDLERVLVGGVLLSLDVKSDDAALRTWAEQSTTALHALVHKMGWKRAFRLFGAAIDPRAELTFAERVLQDARFKSRCLEAVQATPVQTALRTLLGPHEGG